MPNVVLGLGGAFVLHRGVERALGKRAANLGTLLLLACPYWFFLARQTMVDMTMAGPLAACLGFWLLASESSDGAQRGTTPAGAWIQVVGVVRDLSLAKPNKTSEDATLFRPVAPEGASMLRVLVRARGDAAQASPLVRRAAAETDPTLRIYDLMPLERIEDTDIATGRFFVTATGVVRGSV